MNIAKILKGAPKGTELFSTVFGPVYLVEVTTNVDYPIHAVLNKNYTDNAPLLFTSDGRYTKTGECVLFPSNKCRDWNNYVANPSEIPFKPGDKVVVKNYSTGFWTLDIFCYFDKDEYEHTQYANGPFPFVCIADSYDGCLKFDENSVKLIGTAIKKDCC